MKNEKFCFSKGTGLIALVGIFLIVAVFAMNTVTTSEKQSTGAKASFGCPGVGSYPVASTDVGKYTCPWPMTNDVGAPVTFMNPAGGFPLYKPAYESTCCYAVATFSGGNCPVGSAPRPVCLKAGVTLPVIGRLSVDDDTGVYVKNNTFNVEWPCCKTHTGDGFSLPTTAPTVAAVVPTTVVPTTPASSTLTQDNKYCTNLNLFDVPKDFATYYYNYYCKVNEQKPHWDGLKCTAAVGVCGNNRGCLNDMCISVQNQSLRCLNAEVPFDWCLKAGVAHDYDAPGYVGDGKCENRTCAGNVHINECAPQSIKKCICKQGMSYPTYVDDTTKCKITTIVNCMYAEQIITTSTMPYTHVKSSVDPAKKCIQKDGKNIGYRCKTDTSGTVNATGSLQDKVNCPLP